MQIDWAAILPAILVLATSIIFMILVAFEIQQYEQHLNTLKQRQIHQFNTVDAEYQQLKKISDLIKNDYLNKLDELKNIGFIQKKTINIQKQRLKLFTKIETSLKKLPLITANYAVSEIKTFANISQTQLTLKLGILHESNLLQTIEKLMALPIKGLLILNKCSLKPLAEKIDLNKISEAYFEALCVLSWHLATLDKQ
ncbi:hypothetical protein [Candidatus Marithrix sp. Canyon 246]|uniref:hypothetical protein n=1 Tax=Candidatus Marithrix sp. Canyon 246 TaxID=1827136 RepID=UPI00084A1CD5|nr:hypothetical protein [Candidatus Marithrix sp. Canyon 246]